MTSYYVWFALFTIISYVIVTDDSVAKLVYILSQLARFQYEKTKWWILHNPTNPIVKYLMWRRAMKLAKEIRNEILNKNKL
jgi:hypothetical protein